MSMSFQMCLHVAIIICLGVSLSGNSVSSNTTVIDGMTKTETQDISTTTEPTTLPETSSETEKLSTSKLKEESTKPVVITDATKSSSATEKSSKSSILTSESSSTKTTTPTSTSTSSASPTKLNSTQSSKTSSTTSAAPNITATSSTSTSTASAKDPVETITNGQGISAIKIHGKKKRLSLSDLANTTSTTTTTTTTSTTPESTSPKPKKTNKKKKKRRPSRQPKKQKGSSGTTSTDDEISVTQRPAGPGKDPASILTTAYPLSPDATIHTVEPGVKPVLFAAAAADNKKGGGGGGGGKKAGKKGARKAGKAQGKKGDPGPPGPAGPKGPKGEPGSAAESSMPMQAASSAVLTEHFGPDKDVIVPFDLKLIDLADNYDNTTGVFICTIPGVYVVSLYLMSHPGAKVNARVFINSRPIAALWADDSKNSGFYPSSSIQTVSRLAFGDQVYVMLVDGGYGESWVHANYNAFSLFLLYEEVFFK